MFPMISHIHPWAGAVVRGELGWCLSGRPLPDVHGGALGEASGIVSFHFVNKVDRKGRVSVPATFRSTLATNRQPNSHRLSLVRMPAVECTGSDRIEEMQTIESSRPVLRRIREPYPAFRRRASADDGRRGPRDPAGETERARADHRPTWRLSASARCFSSGIRAAIDEHSAQCANARGARVRPCRRADRPEPALTGVAA